MSRTALRLAVVASTLAGALALAGCGAIDVDGAVPVGTTPATPTGPTDPSDPVPPAGFVEVKDETGQLVVWVPEAWTDLDGSTIDDTMGGTWPTLNASTDLDAFSQGFETPGLFFQASTAYPDHSADEVFSATTEDLGNNCDPYSSDPYDDGVFVGTFAWYVNCGETPNTQAALFIGATDDEQTKVILYAQFEPGKDETATMQTIMGSFNTAL